jgi:hypothetical protein
MTGVMLAAAATVAAAADPPPPRPEMKLLRWEEDWSKLLAGMESDPFDGLKWQPLGGEWHLTSGGSVRIRPEWDDNRTLGASPVDSDALVRGRTFLHLDISHAKDFRWFVEARASDTWSSERPVPGSFEDDPDLENFFLEGTFASTTPHPVTLRVGRQELLFGSQRLVSPLDWASTRRNLDGVTLTSRTKRTKTVVFATHPVMREPDDIDSPDDDVLFWGVDATIRPWDGHLLEPYAYVLHDEKRVAAEDGGDLGDSTRLTYGLRYELSAADGWYAEAEVSLQDGHASRDDVRASSVSLTGGRQWKEAAWKPRLLAGVDLATGDGDPTDGERGTFNQLFPLGHAYLGHVDLVGRQNVEAARVQVEVWPFKGFKWETALHRFALEEERDSLYDAGGKGIRKDPTGMSGDGVATELDVIISYTWKRHHAVSLEICQWWSGDFIEQTGPGDDATFVWAAYDFRF